MDLAKLLNRSLVVLLVATLFAYWRVVVAIIPPEFNLLTLVVSLHLSLLVASIVGLWRFRAWGYYSTYVLIPTSTVLLALSFVPFVTAIFPEDTRPIVLTVINVGVLLLAMAAHVAYRRTAAGGYHPARS